MTTATPDRPPAIHATGQMQLPFTAPIPDEELDTLPPLNIPKSLAQARALGSRASAREAALLHVWRLHENGRNPTVFTVMDGLEIGYRAALAHVEALTAEGLWPPAAKPGGASRDHGTGDSRLMQRERSKVGIIMTRRGKSSGHHG